MRLFTIFALSTILLLGANVGFGSDVIETPDQRIERIQAGPAEQNPALLAFNYTPDPVLQEETSTDAPEGSGAEAEKVDPDDIAKLLEDLAPLIREFPQGGSVTEIISWTVRIVILLIVFLLGKVLNRTSDKNMKRVVRDAIREEKGTGG